MLSNPHWDAPSYSSFEAWLETQNPNESYPFTDSHNCACAKYLKHVGKFEEHWLRHMRSSGDIMARLNGLAAGAKGYKYGALLEAVRNREFA